MRSDYKKLGSYIKQIDIRNTEDKKNNLLGVSTQKIFIESIANTVGTDFKKYKIVKKYQFTYVPDTSRRGDRIGLAMLEHLDEALVSQAYTVFEIVDHNELDPEYLMMWFRRPEFDRYARYKSHGSVREIFDWDEMCDVELPVPSIEKQREIVKEYNTIINRIKLNEQLNQKLEEAAQAIYKQWFVDFEFPISEEYANSIGKPELVGKPYKSNGGEMVFNEGLEQEIPKGWRYGIVSDIGQNKRKAFNLKKNFPIISYIGLEHMPQKSIALGNWDKVTSIGSNKHCFLKGEILFGKLRPYFHKVGVALTDGICSTDIIVADSLQDYTFGLLLMILSSNDFIQYANSGSGGTKMPRTDWNHMSSYKITIPSTTILKKFNFYTKIILSNIENNCNSILLLKDLEYSLLSSMASKQLQAVSC